MIHPSNNRTQQATALSDRNGAFRCCWHVALWAAALTQQGKSLRAPALGGGEGCKGGVGGGGFVNMNRMNRRGNLGLINEIGINK